MIFDERDIENFEEKEEILTPNKNQLSFDDLDKKETKKNNTCSFFEGFWKGVRGRTFFSKRFSPRKRE